MGRQLYTALAVMQAGDAALTAVPVPFVAKCLDDVGFPLERRWVLVAAKGASALGLAAVWRSPALARLTTVLLTLYFVLAVGSHVRARDFGRNALAASTLLALFGTLAARGPSAPSS